MRECKETRLQAIHERDPRNVAHGEHKPEPVRRDIHRRQDRGLVVQRVPDVPDLESTDKPHGVGDVGEATTADGLFTYHTDVNERPEDEAWAELVEGLDVEGADGRVELAADKELLRRSELV